MATNNQVNNAGGGSSSIPLNGITNNNATAVKGGYYLFAITVGSYALTFPSSPADGDYFYFGQIFIPGGGSNVALSTAIGVGVVETQGNTTISDINPGSSYLAVYNASNTTWYAIPFDIYNPFVTYNDGSTSGIAVFSGSNNLTGTQNIFTTGTTTLQGLNTTNNKLVTVNSSGVLSSSGGTQILNANATTSNTTATNTNLTFPIAASETYTVVIIGTAQKATSGTGMKFAIAAPTGATIKGTSYLGGLTYATALVQAAMPAINTLNSTAFATGTGVEVPFRLEFTVKNSTTAGDITFQYATVTSNVATIFAGSSMTYIKGSAV